MAPQEHDAPGSSPGWVGRSLRRVEDPVLLRGDGAFVADLVGGAAIARFVRSPVASGRIRHIGRPPGALVFTADDLGDIRDLRPMLHRPDFVPVSQPVLARDRVRFVGEPVAVVVAASAAEAEDLAEEVEVDIDADSAVIDVDDAIRPDAPVVHEVPAGFERNTVIDAGVSTPGVDAAFAAAHVVVDVTVMCDRQNAMPLEARGCVADYDRRTGRVVVSASTQGPHMLRTALADLLGIPESDVRVIAPDVGGGFGQKYSVAREDVVVTWLARRLKRSVAWVEDRVENLSSAFHSRQHRYRVRGAFDAGGHLRALDADIVCNVGAYSCYPVTCGVEPLMALAEMPGPYLLSDYRARARAVVTNTCPIAPYRGVARPVVTLALERLMDAAAARLAIDPIDIRLRNLVDTFPHRTPTGLVIDEGTYRESVRVAADHLDVAAFRGEQQRLRAEGRLLGLGISSFSERTGYGTPAFVARNMDVTLGYEDVELAMDPSGYVELRIGASPHGQGLRTTLAQVVSDTLGVAPSDVRVSHGDTDRDPYGWGSFASRALVIAGGAARLAATELARKLATIAAEALEAAPEDIRLEGGRAHVVGTDVGVPIAQLARTASHRRERAGGIEGLTARATYDPAGTFSNACHLAVVEVDPVTGGVEIRRFVVVEDAGVLVNPMIVDGQIHGGVCQGIANALYERLHYDDDGNLQTASLMDFLPPTMAEIPEIEILHLETPTEASLLGAKGVGEGGTIGAPAAVLNAVNDAISPYGVSLDRIPITPDRVWAALRGRTMATTA